MEEGEDDREEREEDQADNGKPFEKKRADEEYEPLAARPAIEAREVRGPA